MLTTVTLMQDAELTPMLDHPSFWIARGGMGLLATGTLRQCLQAAATESKAGRSPGTIGKVDDSIVVEHEQMLRLWKFLGMDK